jgi:hypothetical protein
LPEYFENITVNCSSEIVSKFGWHSALHCFF